MKQDTAADLADKIEALVRAVIHEAAPHSTAESYLDMVDAKNELADAIQASTLSTHVQAVLDAGFDVVLQPKVDHAPSPSWSSQWGRSPMQQALDYDEELEMIKSQQLTVVCAWCGNHMSGPITHQPNSTTQVSHGICSSCEEGLNAET